MPRPDKTAWFSHDRFGMFIHWGLYSVPAGVWKGEKAKRDYAEWLQAGNRVPRDEYRQLAQHFNPIDFDAEAWILDAKRAGMKYFLITAKHHDGFALWPTKVSSFNVVDATPFKRDILGELAAACAKHEIRLGFYYSHWQDWDGSGGDVCDEHMVGGEYQHPSEEAFADYWQNKCLAQVRELLENYQPAFFWFDTWNEDSYRYITEARQDELIDLIQAHDPKCLVNSRIQFLKPSDRVDYLSMMDNCFPDKGFDKPWETSGTLNHSWGYHCLDFDWKSSHQLIRYLVGNASLGGNYQLNVGPTDTGAFQPAAIRRLREIGAWMDVNAESVYGTSASPLGKPPWGAVTARELDSGHTRLYLHLWDITPGTALCINDLTAAPLQATVLESGQPIPVETTPQGVQLHLPTELAGLDLPVIALDVEGVVEPLTSETDSL